MRNLIATPFTPLVSTGQGLRLYAIARVLAARGGARILYTPFGADQPSPEFGRVENLELRAVDSARNIGRLAAFARALLAGAPFDMARGASADLLAVARGRGVAAERIVADGPIAAAALLPLARRQAAIYNAHNLESSFRYEAERTSRITQARLRRFEIRLLSTYGETWMASPRDVAAARDLVPTASIRYVPNVLDVAAVKPIDGDPDGSPPVVLFVGNLTYPPNADACGFLVEEVMPLLWRSNPDARLRIVGRGALPALNRDPRVAQIGFVEDLNAEYARCRCVAVPLRTGGGSPLKLIEALAHQRPVVATSRAVAGLELTDREFLRADGAERIARSLAKVLDGDFSALARRGREAAERLYSIESLRARFARHRA